MTPMSNDGDGVPDDTNGDGTPDWLDPTRFIYLPVIARIAG